MQEEILDPRPSFSSRIFFGVDGLRAGWSLLVYLVLLAAPLVVMRGVHRAQPTPQAASEPHLVTPRQTYLSEAATFAWVFLATWVMSRIERRPNSLYGLGLRGRLPQFLAGLLWGVVSLSLLVAILWKLGLLVFDARLLSGAPAVRYGAIWLGGFLLVGLFEDYLMRGYLQFTLARGLTGVANLFAPAWSRGIGFWGAAVMLSFLFGLGHSNNAGESPLGLLAAGIAGLVFCLSLWRTGSLWWAIGFHCTWDWAESFLYGVPDSGTVIAGRLFATHPAGATLLSGGTTGPEGSVFVLPVLGLVAVVILLTLPSRAEAAGPPAP